MGSSASASPLLVVLFPQEGEPWHALLQRISQTEGSTLLVLSGREGELIDRPVLQDSFLQVCRERSDTLTVFTQHPVLIKALRDAGVSGVYSTKAVRVFLKDHPALDEVLRVISPHVWRQQLTSRLQRLGLLSMPRLRIFSLVLLSSILFYIVVFRLLPSADIVIRPRQEPVTQTVNIFLVLGTGTVLKSTGQVRTMPLLPIVIELTKELTFDQISKEFTGTASEVVMTVINSSEEQYSFRANTRFSNQAGMVFRSNESVIVDAGQEAEVSATADPTDLYGQIIGERGNLPAGVKWQIPGLSEPERALVYAENRVAASGGTTSYSTVLKPGDIDLARKRLEQELLAAAKTAVEDKLAEIQRKDRGAVLELLRYDQLTEIAFRDITVPVDQVGRRADAIELAGSIRLRMFAYDTAKVFPILLQELRDHVRDGRRLVESYLGTEQLVAHVIDYPDDQSWIKLTVDLSATEEYVLDPLQPAGALFAKSIRELVAGMTREEAVRIIRNLPEVETVSISQWPPWSRTLPHIGSHISIVSQ
jgi:hypothetical protein